MDKDLIEYLDTVEMKLNSLLRDIQNIRDRLDFRNKPIGHQFFQALTADDDETAKPKSKYMQCPHN